MGEEELRIVVNEDATAEEIAPIAKAVNDLFVMPVAMRSRNKKGVRVDRKSTRLTSGNQDKA